MKLLHLTLAIAVTCLWGFNFSVIKAGVDNIDPFILTALRFSFAAIPAVFFVARPKVSWWYLAAYGLTFGVGLWGMMSLSIELGLSAGMASVILQFSVFITVLMGLFFLKERLSVSRKIGLLLSVLGLFFVLGIEDGSVTLLGFIFSIAGAVSLSVISLIIKKAQIKEMFAFVVWSSLFAPIPLFVLSYAVNGSVGFEFFGQGFNQTGLNSALFQACPTTLLGYWIWNKLQTIYPLSTMAPISLLIPIFGVIGSVIFYSEQLATIKIIACGLIVAGVALPLFGETLWKIFRGNNHFGQDRHKNSLSTQRQK